MGRTIFSDHEKEILCSLVEQHKSILENKATNGINIKKKEEAWNKICKIYNAHGLDEKTPIQLKKCWKNLIQRTRRHHSDQKAHRLLTGGGSPLLSVEDPLLEKVDAICSYNDVEINTFDSTSVYERTHKIPSGSKIKGIYYVNDSDESNNEFSNHAIPKYNKRHKTMDPLYDLDKNPTISIYSDKSNTHELIKQTPVQFLQSFKRTKKPDGAENVHSSCLLATKSPLSKNYANISGNDMELRNSFKKLPTDDINHHFSPSSIIGKNYYNDENSNSFPDYPILKYTKRDTKMDNLYDLDKNQNINIIGDISYNRDLKEESPIPFLKSVNDSVERTKIFDGAESVYSSSLLATERSLWESNANTSANQIKSSLNKTSVDHLSLHKIHPERVTKFTESTDDYKNDSSIRSRNSDCLLVEEECSNKENNYDLAITVIKEYLPNFKVEKIKNSELILRTFKAAESIVYQREVHKMKLKTAETESKLMILKLLKQEDELQKKCEKYDV
ncbi:uncharacterized protein [Prorops nasuta]|uniref:uncharacterized protein isoform X2 n=1 Tax=Prorops nasuta TaxID=863751 RepID=UPI0034CD587E